MKIAFFSMIIVMSLLLAMPSGAFGDAGLLADSQPVSGKAVRLYLHNVSDSGTLDTVMGNPVERLLLRTSASGIGGASILNPEEDIGIWETWEVPMSMVVSGSVRFHIYLSGNLTGVSLRGALTLNGSDVSDMMETSQLDLGEQNATLFSSSVALLDSEIFVAEGARLGLHLWISYQRLLTIVQSKDALLVEGSGEGSRVEVSMDTIYTREVEGAQNPTTGNMDVNATVELGFGVDDFKTVIAESAHGLLYQKTMEVVDSHTLRFGWEWAYTVTQGGSYEVLIKVYDRNNNMWSTSAYIDILTPTTDVDLVLVDVDIIPEGPIEGENATIKASIRGDGVRWGSFDVAVEFYVDGTLLETKDATVLRGSTKDVLVKWAPPSSGEYIIRVLIDADSEVLENFGGMEQNNELTTNVTASEKQESDEGETTPGFELPALVAGLLVVTLIARRDRATRKKKEL